ncbi:Beta-galactosidase [Clostridiaceae bacterium JG1575]|nr:Beta-galactosidase [Clostridiaceae bacterium JG1575]
MLTPKLWEDPNIQHCGRMAPRAYYVPYECLDKAIHAPREASAYFKDLNGPWDFAFFESPEDLVTLQPSQLIFDQVISVPGAWQIEAKDTDPPVYLNQRYPIPFVPPRVPIKNPTGVYQRRVALTTEDLLRRVVLVLEGADSCAYVYVNDRWMGMTKGSHMTAEFDVTDVLHPGENTICLAVLKWCDGTYLEDQDKWRMSGLFRSVYLLTRHPLAPHDVALKTVCPAEGKNAELHIKASNLSEFKEVALYREGTQEVPLMASAAQGVFTLAQANLWSAEDPVWYRLVLRVQDEYIGFTLGFRSVAIRDRTLCLNGRPIKLKGVNRHEFWPTRGPCVSLAQTQKDFALLKKAHVNALRTAHYPNDPRMYDLATQMGFYVMNEADIETHGTIWEGTGDGHVLATDDRFALAFMDRIQRLYERDKNASCVIIWSLGNEAGHGQNFDRAGRWLRERTKELIHYERIFFPNAQEGRMDHKELDLSYIDFYSRMYPSPEWIEKVYLTDETNTRPLILCEYSHAMGNGPGDLRAYMDLCWANDSFCGGFIWEFADHGIPRSKTHGRDYVYGGGFGGGLHDGNFCIDGLVDPDRVPHPAYYEMQKVYEPVTLTFEEGGLRATSRLDFKTLNNLTLRLAARLRGTLLWEKQQILLPLKARDDQWIPLPKIQGMDVLAEVYDGEERLTFEESLGGGAAFREAYSAPAFEAPQPTLGFFEAKNLPLDWGRLSEKSLGFFQEGRPLWPEFCVYRAPTDNDLHRKGHWERLGLDKARCKLKNVQVAQGESTDFLQACFDLEGVVHLLSGELKATMSPGVWAVSVSIGPEESSLDFPRVGLLVPIPKSFTKIRWLGQGPYENYPDKKEAAWFDWHERAIREIPHPYIRPQESGSRGGCYELLLKSPEEELLVHSPTPFSFCVQPLRPEALAALSYDFQRQEALKAQDLWFLHLDLWMSAVGSAACGPPIPQKLCYNGEALQGQFRLERRPVALNQPAHAFSKEGVS